ncbi:condensation domain-containing protein [Streptomyces uncialis]|uniref:Condensation domain-containing protein n=1 Tax=Streptomyces uncialis TaxID=1048205 RepID=A0A1Q4V971_9ACTN|nr:condensation domain-containing protein [Streptomyces uncialis]OKH94386.1 hypothetical protein AB852_08680 [Streptomyces uncialis]
MADEGHDAIPTELTRGQARRWRAACASDNPVDQMSPTYLVTDEIDPLLLGRALARVVRQHAPLRTRIVAGPDGEPVATLRAAPDSYPVKVVDLTGQPTERQADASTRFGATDSAVPVDLATDWPMRVTLVTLEPRRHLLFLTISHVVADGWSCGVVIRGIQSHFRALSRGEATDPGDPQKALEAAWAAFVAESAERERSGWYTRDLGWWRRRLGGAFGVPASDAGPGKGSGESPGEGARSTVALSLPFGLPDPLGKGMRQLASSLRSTTFTITLAALAAVLADLTGTPETVVSVPYAGREEEEHEPLVGLFSDRLLLRVPVDRTATFPELVEQAQDVLLDAVDHASTPSYLVEEALAQDDPEAAHAPSVCMQIYPRSMCDAEPTEPGDLAFRLLGFRTPALHDGLALHMVEPDGGPTTGRLTHLPSFMNPAQAAEFLVFLFRVLSTAVRDQGCSVAEILRAARRGTGAEGGIEVGMGAGTSDDVVLWEQDDWVAASARSHP